MRLEIACDDGGGGGGGGGDEVEVELTDLNRLLLLFPVFNIELRIEEGGGGGGGGGGVDDDWLKRLLMLPVLNRLLKIDFGGGGGGGGGGEGTAIEETEWTRLLLLLFLNRF